jgi:cysteinyl-tRNA synthetase
MLRLFDSLSGEVRELELRDPGKVSMYVCGPTVNGLAHLGHGRFSLVWDVTRRWLTWNGLEVTYVSNVTDIDDRIIKAALEEGRSEPEVARDFEDRWWEAMNGLGVARPTESPHATDYVAEMVELIDRLIGSGHAYVTDDGVYFDVGRLPEYGQLSGQSLDSLRQGARVEVNENKRAPVDFALWKMARDGEPSWPASFGDGRPGWHTECVVMSLALLGDDFDLHVGGQDLRFPHHENERAQALADGRAFARHWDHNGWVEVGGEKMSKSLFNFTTLAELLARTDQRAYRLLVLRSHYRSPIEVSESTIVQAERSLERLDALARRFALRELAGERLEVRDGFDWEGESASLADEVGALLDDDLDTPGALAVLFDAVSLANARADGGDIEGARRVAEAVNALFGALGLPLRSRTDALDEVAAGLATERDEARAQGRFDDADRIRDRLVELGWVVEDGPDGTVLRRR